MPIPLPAAGQHFLKGMGNIEEFQKMQTLNALAEIKRQYAPQTAEADLELKQGQASMIPARTKLLEEQAGHYPFLNALNVAQTRHQNVLSDLAPTKVQLERDRLKQSQSRFGAAYQMARMLSSMPPAQRAHWIAQNQGPYAQMLTDISNESVASMGGGQDMQMSPVQQTNGEVPKNALNMPMVPNNKQFQAPNEQQIAELKQTGLIAANNSLTDAATKRQFSGAMQVEAIMNDPVIQAQAINASKYAGAARKGKAALDALSQTNPEAYEDYIAFKDSTMVLLQNRIKTLDQMGATDKQREELTGLYTKTMDAFTSNPKQFITQYNKLGRTLAIIGKAVEKSASGVSYLKRLEGFNPIVEENANDWSHLSTEELRKIGKGK